jgi:hypothetical protein
MRKIAHLVIGLGVAAVLGGCNDAEPPTSSTADAGLGATAQQAFGQAGSATYEVTITNVTSSQPLTPPLVATHRRPISLFAVGEPASFGLKEIAENGNLGPMLERLEGESHVNDVVVAVSGEVPPLTAGESVTITLEAERGAKYLSFVSMLICTNDGFTGVGGARLPRDLGERSIMQTDGYDAGSEINTEDFADIVPPCPALTGVPSDDPGTGTSDPGLAEGGVIHHHDGIQGIADLDPAIHGWTDPVAQIVIERVQ